MALHPALESDTPYYDALSEDPTATKTLREEYGRNLRGAYDRIKTAIRQGVGENDIFGLQNDALVSPPSSFGFERDDRKLQGFEAWLDNAQEEEVLTLIDRDGNRYIERAYEKGVRDADRNLARAGMDLDPVDAAAARVIMRMPTHERKLQTIYTRNYQQLRGITQAVDQHVSRELADGIASGLNPREMARNINDRVEKIGKTRATTLARTETINAHSSASIERYRQQGIEEVGLEPEVGVSTAGDNLVCPDCAEVAQRGPYSLDELEGSDNQPPIHPNCRCSVIPIT